MKCRAALLLLLVGASHAHADGEAAALEKAVQEAIRNAEPSVACVLVSRSELYLKYEPKRPRDDTPGRLGDFPRCEAGGRNEEPEQVARRKLDMSQADYVPESFGSGIVIDRSGLILTNAHVVRGAVKVFVRLPGGVESYADIHALDSRSDLAVLRLNGRVPPLKPIAMGDGDAVRKGQFVVALANPHAAGFRDGGPSASAGIISNLRRRIVSLPGETDRHRLALHQFGTMLMTDARLALGCSGGALVNLKGELIGVTTSQAALTGLEAPGGFALPLSEGVRRIIGVLREGKEVEYGFLGISFAPIEGPGVRVGTVKKNSPADRAGLHPQDFILAVAGVPVSDMDDVFVLVGTMLAGNTVEIERSSARGGQRDKLRVKLGKYYTTQPFIASNRPKPVAGLRVDDACIHIQKTNWPFRENVPEGVMIRDVEPDSPADKARLQPDKIITHVNGKAVNTPEEFYAAMANQKGSVELTVRKFEGGSERITLRLD